MKSLPGFLIGVLFCNFVFSQARFQIVEKKSSNLRPYYSKSFKQYLDTIHLPVRLTGNFDPVHEDSNALKLEIRRYNLPNNPLLQTNKITFPEEVWPAGRSKVFLDTVVTLNIITQTIGDTLKNDESGHVVIVGQTLDQYHTIRLSNKNSLYDPRYSGKPFWVEVGTNFDLIDGPEPNNLFSGIFFYKRDMRPFTFRKRGDHLTKKLGAFAGVFESKTITSVIEQHFSLREYYDSSSIMPNVKDTLKVFKGIGSIVNRRTVRNLGLFFSPQVRLTNGSANEDGFHVFAAFWMELQWQKIVEETEFNQLQKLDSSNKPLDSVLGNASYNVPNNKNEIDVRSHYFGLGLPIFFKETIDNNTIHLFLNPVIGISNQPTQEYFEQRVHFKQTAPVDRRWLPFYVIQFRLNEESYGISFTGEVRGLLLKNNPPFVSIALSKKFDLTKFIEFDK